MTRAPLRFLLTLLALWAGVRAAILWPGASADIAAVPAAAARPSPPVVTPPPAERALGATAEAWLARILADNGELPRSARRDGIRGTALPPMMLAGLTEHPSTPGLRTGPRADARGPPPGGLTPSPLPSSPPPASRWSVSAWLLLRDEGGANGLAPGGTLGGSQAGARLTYALGSGIALSARAYLPLRRAAGAELAAGIDWHPLRSLPVDLLAERRQRLGRDGRSSFAVTLYGGASRNLTPRLRVDAYGQAGLVGLHSRDPFVDGSVRLSRSAGPVEFGAGIWGAAQPGGARLDAGPSLSWRLPVRAANLRLQADWRFRIAGEAAPGSGPALTLATDF